MSLLPTIKRFIAFSYSTLHPVLFWSAVSRIWTEYGEILRISLYLVRMRENVDHYNSEYRCFSHSVCQPKTGNLCCKQVKHTNTFSSRFIKKTYSIYNKLNNCKSSYSVYLLEFTLCKQQYTGKSKTALNIRL